MAATIRDVAKKARVSVGTVSRYLNGARLREKNRISIENAIEELGFEANFFARGLTKSKTMAVAVLVPHTDDYFSGSIIKVLERELGKKNYSIMVSNYHGDADILEKRLIFFKTRVDGIVLFPYFIKQDGKVGSLIKKYIDAGIPTQIFNEDIRGVATDKFFTDNVNASFRAIEYFIHHGHTKIAVINGQNNDYVGINRHKGFLDAMQLYGIPVNERYIKYGGYTMNGGYEAAIELLDSSDRPTALYITNYLMTFGAMMAIQEKNIKVPDELSVIGFDYMRFADIIVPPINVVEQSIEKMGESVAKLMLARIEGDFDEFPKVQYFPAKMLVRDSVKKI